MKWLLAMQLTAWSALVAIGGELPSVWMSTSFMKDLGVFEKTVKDCRAHGVDVMDNGSTPGASLGERVEAYALDCGFSKEDIAKFRGIMLER